MYVAEGRTPPRDDPLLLLPAFCMAIPGCSPFSPEIESARRLK